MNQNGVARHIRKGGSSGPSDVTDRPPLDRSGDTYGLRLQEKNDYRNGYILETRLNLAAWTLKGEANGFGVAGRDPDGACSMTPEERQEFFNKNHYWPLIFVPRRISPKAAAGGYNKGRFRRFPTESRYDFLFSESARVTIERDELSGVIELVNELPWGLSSNGSDLKLDFVHDDYSHASEIPLGLRLHLSMVFRPVQQNQRPLEFEWGVPGVYSSHFESNRRRH